jgi:hypothetical protein
MSQVSYCLPGCPYSWKNDPFRAEYFFIVMSYATGKSQLLKGTFHTLQVSGFIINDRNQFIYIYLSDSAQNASNARREISEE